MTPQPPTLQAFKAWSKDCAPAARAVLMARVYAQMEREWVAAYIAPIFASYQFRYSWKWWGRTGEPGLIPTPEKLYLCDDEPMMKAYYAECDEAHRAHGFTGPAGHCPALTAETLQRTTESLLIGLAQPLFDIKSDQIHGENRAKYLELIIGSCLKAEKDGTK